MDPVKFQYLHQTVEHCLTRPLPDNVDVAYRAYDEVLYTVDLPASVWATVTISDDDKYTNDLQTFTSPSLRQDWIDLYIRSRRSISP